MQSVFGDADGVCDAVGVEYVSRVPRPPLDGLIDDLYYLEGAPPYARLTRPPMPSALLIVNLGAPFRIRAGTDIETAEYADGDRKSTRLNSSHVKSSYAVFCL